MSQESPLRPQQLHLAMEIYQRTAVYGRTDQEMNKVAALDALEMAKTFFDAVENWKP